MQLHVVDDKGTHKGGIKKKKQEGIRAALFSATFPNVLVFGQACWTEVYLSFTQWPNRYWDKHAVNNIILINFSFILEKSNPRWLKSKCLKRRPNQWKRKKDGEDKIIGCQYDEGHVQCREKVEFELPHKINWNILVKMTCNESENDYFCFLHRILWHTSKSVSFFLTLQLNCKKISRKKCVVGFNQFDHWQIISCCGPVY